MKIDHAHTYTVQSKNIETHRFILRVFRTDFDPEYMNRFKNSLSKPCEITVVHIQREGLLVFSGILSTNGDYLLFKLFFQ